MIERKEVKDAWMEDVLRVRAHLLLKLNRDGCQSLYHLLLCRHGRRRNLLRKRRQKERASLIKYLVIFDVFQETKNVSALFVPKYTDGFCFHKVIMSVDNRNDATLFF